MSYLINLIFSTKIKKLATKFYGPFKILRVKSPQNFQFLLSNVRKIVVNVTRVKPYYSPEATSCLSTNSHEETISSTC